MCREFARSWSGKGSRPTDGEMERVLSASAAMLLLLSGDVETNPGPIGRSRSREPKPDPKKIMEEKVDFAKSGEGPKELLIFSLLLQVESHGTKIEELEELVKAQAALIEKLGRDSKELSRQQSHLN